MKAKIVGLIGMICIFLPLTLLAQIQNVPNDVKNTRFYSDVFSIKRPGLSINGFDDGGDHSKGYGLKQILEMLYNGSADPLMVSTYNKIIDILDNLLVDPFNPDPGDDRNALQIVNANSNILQSRAFVALARYILYKNGIIDQIPSATQTAPSYSVALSDMKSAFLEPEDWLLANSNHKDDQVKWTRTVGNYARALDLYLAVENAFDFYGESTYDSRLLTQAQKNQVISQLKNKLDELNDYLYTLIEVIWGINAPGVRIYEAEPGNRPMKMFLAMGYGALTLQDYDSNVSNTAHDYLQKAFRSGGLQEEKNSIKYWSYQSRNGKRFWAEGPYYFEFTLNDVVPFWHAIRANNMLNYNGYNILDPFNNTWFLNPLSWLGDLTTPYGELPPLDDGNKRSIRYANLLRWNGTYGDATVGKKFAWIGDQIKDKNGILDKHTLSVQIATPHISESNGTEPVELAGNANSYTQSNSSEKQLVLRHKDVSENEHYVLLNGESNDAITRGEGHEQPDQMQLLYYIDGTSFLMDRGYDGASPTDNSSYNFYKAHNVMSYANPYYHGGIPAPHLATSLGRKQSDHQWIDKLYYKTPSNRVTEFYGSVLLRLDRLAIVGRYNRDVLFVKGDEPYLIDLNSLDTQVYDPQKYNEEINNFGGSVQELIFYHGFSNYFSQSSTWKYWDIIGSAKNLYMHLRSVEFGGSTIGSISVQSEEMNEDFRDIQRAVLAYYAPIPNPISDYYDQYNPYRRYYTTVAILKADDTAPVNPQPIFTYQSNKKTPHQGWYWKHNASTVDVIIKRSKVNMTKYNQHLDFDLLSDGLFIPAIRLPAGKDYGFARFQKNNGVWEIDPDYQVNLTSNYFAYTGSSSVGNQTYPSDAVLHIASSSTLTITGDVTLQSGTTVYLDPDAKVEVTSGGSIDADGVTFKTTSGSTGPSDLWKHIKLASGGNTFTDCIFIGAEKALYVNNAYGATNQVQNSGFAGNQVAAYITDGGLTLAGTDMQQPGGTNGIIVRGSGDLATTSTGSGSSFAPTTIENHGTGIYAYEYSTAYIKHTRFTQNDYNIKAAGQGQVNAGQNSYQNLPFGYNHFGLAGTYDLYNTSTYTLNARYNWWGWAAEPNASRFYGTVDYDDALSCDPTTDGTYCDPIDDGGGGGCYPYCYSAAPAPTPTLTSQTGGAFMDGSTATTQTQGEHPGVREQITSLYQAIEARPDDPNIYRSAHQIHLLLDLYDSDGSLRAWAGFDGKLAQWQALLLNDGSADLSGDGDRSSTREPVADRSLAAYRLGQAAVLLEMREVLETRNYDEVLRLADRWEPHLTTNKGQIALLAARAVAWERTKQFGKALAAYEAIQQLEPQRKSKGQNEGVAPDYSIVKAELADSMAAHGQSKGMLAGSGSPDEEETSEVPQTLEIAEPYPNPFNPVTSIPFSLPERSHVKVEVYNMLGRRVALLADRSYEAGRYRLPLNGKNLSSGVYFVRL